MIYQEKVYIPASENIIEHQLAPCIVCAGENIKVREYEDKYGGITTVLCLDCEQKYGKKAISASSIKNWNQRNDIDLLLIKKAELIEKSKLEIKELKELQKLRRRGR